MRISSIITSALREILASIRHLLVRVCVPDFDCMSYETRRLLRNPVDRKRYFAAIRQLRNGAERAEFVSTKGEVVELC